MEHPSAYSGQNVVILGLARSGVAAAKYFHQVGAKVVVNDKKDRELCPEADELTALGISVICGYHPEDLIHPEVRLVVKNPGIPYKIAPIAKALELGIEIVTEVELAYRVCEAPMIGITGSNGKTTTTTWVGNMLKEAGQRPIVAGNIGTPLTEAALDAMPEDTMVVELSSFQLKGTQQFRPHIACLLNLYETHLDYHGDLEDYIASKAKLFANQTKQDIAILNADDEVCAKLMNEVQAHVIPFSMTQELSYGLFLRQYGEENSLVYKDECGSIHPIVRVQDIGIPGAFNVENALAASAIAIAAGVGLEVISKCLSEFRGVEHRLEYVAEKGGITFYNNSKATNPAATIKAIESFEQPIVLLAGGLDRGSDYMELLPFFENNIKAVVALGETRHKIIQVAQRAGLTKVKTVDTANHAEEALTEAVQAAYAFAEPGDVVLLSPACASWDMFPSYEERGRIFKESVHNLV